jgi:murein DD-endopeptidase MepM/ murein hydrolase activator NlpD
MSRHTLRSLIFACLLAGGCGLLSSEPEPEPVHHTVARGDTLSKLAKKHDTTVAQLQAWNHLQSDRIDIGQQLVVGWSGEPPPKPEAPSATPQKKRTRRARTTTPSPAPSAAGLSLPPEQPCLDGPSLEDGGNDPAFAGSAGLSRGQVRSAMNAFLPTLQRCITDEWPTGTVHLSITVACTGRVARVRVQDDGGLEPTLVACVADTLRYAPFPAHDLPDGETFGYPMVFSQ